MANETNQTQRKLAVVTGASTGIGYELAKQFGEHDYDLVIAADDASIVEAAQSLGQTGVEVRPIRVNLAIPAGVMMLYNEIKGMGREVDALVLNAGVGVNGDFVRQNKLEDEINLIGLNITSVVHLSKLLLPDMVARNEGKVLITSSIAALMPGPFYATYAASKSFLLSFSEAIHNELKDTNVTVTALMPGATDTEFFNRAHMQDTKVATQPKDDPALVAKQGFEALMAGKDHVIGGSFKNKLEGFMTSFMSEQQRAEQQRKMTEPGSASH